VTGGLERAQAIFDQGRLVASHSYRQVIAGPGGGDIAKISIGRPVVRRHLNELGQHLNWHGALSVDYILGEHGGPQYIDCNPRLVEPVNAMLAGVPLTETLTRLSLGESLPELPPGREGVRTHMAILSLLECARQKGTPTEQFRLWRSLRRRTGQFAGSVEELTPVRLDWPSAFPLALVAIWMLAKPSAARQTSRTYASSHQLSSSATKVIRDRYQAKKARPTP